MHLRVGDRLGCCARCAQGVPYEDAPPSWGTAAAAAAILGVGPALELRLHHGPAQAAIEVQREAAVVSGPAAI